MYIIISMYIACVIYNTALSGTPAPLYDGLRTEAVI